MGQDAHEPDRHPRCHGRDLHLSRQWPTARAQLDGAVSPRRARASALHQRLLDEHFRCAHSRPKITVVQADGNDVEPVTVDEFRIGAAETYDVIVAARCRSRLHDFRPGRRSQRLCARHAGTARRHEAEVPPLDPRPLRTMADMGMGSDVGMDHGMPAWPAWSRAWRLPHGRRCRAWVSCVANARRSTGSRSRVEVDNSR